jgi:hypothetical protein
MSTTTTNDCAARNDAEGLSVPVVSVGLAGLAVGNAELGEGSAPGTMRNKQPNSQLLPEAKMEKRKLKKEFKRRLKVEKLETRIRHSVRRKDSVVEAETRKELEELLKDAVGNGIKITSVSLSECPKPAAPLPCGTNAAPCVFLSPEEQMAKDWFIKIFIKLLKYDNTASNKEQALEDSSDYHVKTSSATIRHVQTAHARKLLRHMSKGTQTKEMLSNEVALWGYTRQKFVQRAELVLHALFQLHSNGTSRQQADNAKTGVNKDINNANHQSHERILERQRRVRDLMRLKMKGVKRACSVACGPGNDMIGLLAYLHEEQKQENKPQNNSKDAAIQQPLLQSATCVDFAIEDWSRMLTPLETIVCPAYTSEFVTMFCDITRPLAQGEQQQSRETPSPLEHQDFFSSETAAEMDIFLFSYILTETRHQWEEFVVKLVHTAKLGTLLYFAEPAPWQLHRLLHIIEIETGETDFRLDHAWLDSSISFPEQQAMDRRMGPAVIMLIKSKRD